MSVKINKQKAKDSASKKAEPKAEPKPETKQAAEQEQQATAAATGATKFSKGEKASGEAKTDKKEARHHRFIERIEYAATLTLMQKYDDETIKKMVDEKFPGYAVIFNQKEIGRTRWMIKHDMLPNVHANGKPFDRCFLIEGKLVPRAEKPKTKYSRKPKYTPENDPLAKFAGVNVHDKKPVDKKPVKKAEPAEAKTEA